MTTESEEVDCKALLKLVTSLQTLTASQQQVNINKFLSEVLDCATVFIVPVDHTESDNLHIQVVGSKNRQKHSQAPLPVSKVLLNQIESGKLIHKSDLTSDDVLQLKTILNTDIKSFLSVPILHKHQDKTRILKRRRTSSIFYDPENDPNLSGCSPESKSNGVSGSESDASTRVREESGPCVALLVCLVNKKQGSTFTNTDIATVYQVIEACIGVLLTSLTLESELRIKSHLQKLLTVAKNLFSHLGDVTVLLRQIMAEARHLTQAERCSLFLVDKKNQELVAKVFDGNILPDGSTEQSEVRLPLDTGIVGHVVKTGNLININNVYNHPLFYKGCDQETGFKTRNILCFPISDNDEVIGVAELCNKQSGSHFTKFDEEMAMAFSSYCGLAILHSLMYKKVADAQYRSKLSNELMMYHMKLSEQDSEVSDDEVTKLVSNSLQSIRNIFPEFDKFSFCPRTISDNDSVIAMFGMFEDLGMISRFRIARDSLARFILLVRRGYRSPPYHNWCHGFTVAHFAYLVLHNSKLLQTGVVSPIEAFALLIAAMCHDLDHRGTNNSYQISSNSVLACLYSSEGSVMERHHFAQCMCILNTEGCNILENLTKTDYTRCLDLIRDNILATDLAYHLRTLQDMQEMLTAGVSSSNANHRHLVSCLLMTSADLSDQTKEWINAKKSARLVYSEFFTQGDLEKAMGNKPVESMDREKAFIPSLQIQFIDHIVLPVYKLLKDVDENVYQPYQAVAKNKLYWSTMKNILEERRVKEKIDVMDIFDDQQLEKDVIRLTKV